MGCPSPFLFFCLGPQERCACVCSSMVAGFLQPLRSHVKEWGPRGLYSFFLVREMRDICSVLAARGCSPSIFLELESGVVCPSSRPGPSWGQGLPSPSSCDGQGLGATYPQQLSWVKGLLPCNSCPRPGSGTVLPSWPPWTTLGSEAVLPSSCFGPGWGEGMTLHH